MFFKKKKKAQLDKNRILNAPLPQHIAIILDGNGRWAKKRGLPRTAGHQEGAMNVREITKICANIGVKALTVYAFSTENWKRPEEEVKFLMKLPIKFFNMGIELIENDIRLKVIGNVEDLPKDLQKKVLEITEMTQNNKKMTLTIALNYGSRDEIKQAVQQIATDVLDHQLKVEEISEDLIDRYLMTYDLPPLDLMIRTSGELRISNYLLWQLAYAELYFTSIAWPDFKEQQLYEALFDYQSRQRRFGGLSEKK